VNDALLDAGIVIPFPQRDLHIKSDPGNDSDAPSAQDARSASESTSVSAKPSV
jgi:small-conductance mechanosensitive channel